MGCFSHMCKECGTPINSDSYRGEHCIMFILENGRIIEQMAGQYDSYGSVFDDNGESLEWNTDWGDVVDLHYNTFDNDGVAAYHSKCYVKAGRPIPETISKNDPDQGWNKIRKKFLDSAGI